MKEQRLIFVYNANSNLFSCVSDFAHKILSPSTYQCKLCSLTYGNFSVRHEWKYFVKSLPVKTIFLHKDQFLKTYEMNVDFPAVFTAVNALIEQLISRNEIESCRRLDELKNLVSTKLKDHVQYHHSDI